MKRQDSSLWHWVAVVLLPWLLGFATITVAVSPAYPRLEYAKANFPADLAPLGPAARGELARAYNIPVEQVAWTQDQRLALALVAVDYLQRWDSAENTIYLLEEQRIPGSTVPLYNAEEISHMVDVKRLTNAIRWLAIGVGTVVAAALALEYRRAGRTALARIAWRGGAATVLILGVLALIIVVSWDWFFVTFHELLFPPDTWMFLYTDSLIRLFPEKFWFDYGVLVVGSVLVQGVLLAGIGRIALRRAHS